MEIHAIGDACAEQVINSFTGFNSINLSVRKDWKSLKFVISLQHNISDEISLWTKFRSVTRQFLRLDKISFRGDSNFHIFCDVQNARHFGPI